MGNSCRNCDHLRRESESWEMDHIWWLVCDGRPGAENLKSFPFKNTKCKEFKAIDRPLKATSILGKLGLYEPAPEMDTKHREVNFRPPVKWEE